MRINTKLATLVHARDNESNESITDMTEGLPFFPLLCPRVSGSGNYLPCVIIIRGVKSRHTRVSRPSRARCRPRFFHLRPVHSLGRCTRTRTRHTHTTHAHTHVHISRDTSSSFANQQPTCPAVRIFDAVAGNETGPECIRLRLKYLPICSEPFGRFPFPRAGPMAAEARTFHGKLVEASAPRIAFEYNDFLFFFFFFRRDDSLMFLGSCLGFVS